MIELPVSVRTSQAASDQTVESLTPIGAKELLVIDDEPDIASVLCEILKQDGHHVDPAGEGAAGLELLGQRSYDLVLTDTKMPGLDGVGFFREVERRFPTLKGRLIFLTGDLLSRDKREFLESTGAPCLTKPFDVEDVRRLVHRMLSTQPH